MADEQRINGTMYSWSSIYAKFDGERYYGFKSISYGDSRTRTKAYGSARHHAPRGRTAGKYEVDPVAVSFEKKSAQALRKALAAKSADGKAYGNVPFEIVIQFDEPDEADTITHTLETCVWGKNAASNEEGPDPLYEDLEFDCMSIDWGDGLRLYDSTEGEA